MVRLKSRTQFPVNGFQFIDAAISGEPLSSWVGFEDLVAQVQARRQANPRFNLSTDLGDIRREVDNQNAMRMLSIRGADSYITDDSGGPAPNRLAPPRLRRAVEAVAGGVKRTASGAGALVDWLGHGGVPVPNAQSDSRAGVCAVCPKNGKGDWTRWFTEPVAAVIREQLAIRKDLNLTTTYDDKLVVCEACGCPLKLKVHVPLPHIAEHLTDEVKGKLDAGCWILQEMNQ